MKVIERNVQEIGKSLLVTLPKEWTKLLKINKGSKIKMMISEQGNLSIAPEFVKQEEKIEAVINFDQYFNRRFFQEYFNGNEKITVLINKPLDEDEKKQFYIFLKRFINVQVIEETDAKIVVKCFKIDELSIEECLRRMFFLSLNMIDESSSGNDKTKMKEMRDTLTRFYYMLVMQVRRFLSEGKFIKENQISLIRAMDIRMVAEKIQRVGSVVYGFDKIENKQVISSMAPVRANYSESFSCFINNNYENALKLWHPGENNPLRLKPLLSYRKKRSDVSLSQQASKLTEISRYAKEISMLVR